jgi:Predicted redox protein, regulator of disulfide bond formation
MDATAEHTAGDFQSIVDNGRAHGIVVDLPPDKEGDDMGPTALELTGMALASCVSTIWAKVATNSGVQYRKIEVDVELDHPAGAPTVTNAEATVRVDSSEDVSKLERVLRKTMEACPVGRLFEKAGVEPTTTLIQDDLTGTENG